MSTTPARAGAPPALAIRGMSKTFLGQRALCEVDFDLRPGEVHALLGENGSGKSTLIKCLAGYHAPDPGGELEIAGEAVPLPYQPADATRMGLTFVHQDLGLLPNLTVAENFAIDRKYDAPLLGRIGWGAVEERAEAELAALGHRLDPRSRVGRLPIAEQTLVAIARALAAAEEGARVLVLDEPTAALPDARRRVAAGSRNEVDLLFEAIRKVVGQGVGVIYVSHKLHEILALADRATVLRDGRRVDSFSVSDVSESELVKAIVGHQPAREAVAAQRIGATGRPLLEVSDLSGRRLDGVSFSMAEGELVGIAGMLGSGRSELARILFGAQRRTGGTIRIKGRAVEYAEPRNAVKDGVVLVPENRRRDGAVMDMSVAQNISLPSINQFFRGGRLRKGPLERHCAQAVRDYTIVPASTATRVRLLSGGNQQKVVIAKWLTTAPQLAIFDEPVQGVDVGARAEIYDLVRRTAHGGAGVLVISSEMEPLLELCTRVLVLRSGQLIADLDTDGLARHELVERVYFGTPAGPKAIEATTRPNPRNSHDT